MGASHGKKTRRSHETPAGSPPRVDLRRQGACFPYLPAPDQGTRVSCVAEVLAAALYCAKAQRGLPLLPATAVGFPDVDAIYSGALRQSQHPRRGTSFRGVLAELLARHGRDLEQLNLTPRFLANDAEAVRVELRAGRPVAAGYQVNSEIDRFHENPMECEAYSYVLPSFRKDPRALTGHAVLLVGYDDSVQCFMARNSWGPRWGVDGHFLVRYADLEDDAAFTDLLVFGSYIDRPSEGFGGSSAPSTEDPRRYPEVSRLT